MALSMKNYAGVLPKDLSPELPGYACLLGNTLETAAVALAQPNFSFEMVWLPRKIWFVSVHHDWLPFFFFWVLSMKIDKIIEICELSLGEYIDIYFFYELIFSSLLIDPAYMAVIFPMMIQFSRHVFL